MKINRGLDDIHVDHVRINHEPCGQHMMVLLVQRTDGGTTRNDETKMTDGVRRNEEELSALTRFIDCNPNQAIIQYSALLHRVYLVVHDTQVWAKIAVFETTGKNSVLGRWGAALGPPIWKKN